VHMIDVENKIDYSAIIDKYPWIVKRNQKYILSPDSDGFLCALLLTNYLDSQVVGFYDGKVALIAGIPPSRSVSSLIWTLTENI